MLRISRFFLSLVVAGLLTSQLVADPSSAVAVSSGQNALEAAASANRYVFIYFWKQDDPAQQAMRPIFDAAMTKARDKADTLVVNVLAASDKAIVDRFNVSRAPMPLVLAVAPNGAITKGLHSRFTEQEILSGFVSAGTAGCLKAMQEQKLLLLCVQNETVQYHREALTTAQQFRNDPRFSQATNVIVVNPADANEGKLLSDLQVDPRSQSAITVFVAPSGKIIGKFQGPVTMQQLLSSYQAAQSGHGHDCKDPNCKHCQPKK